LPGSGKGVFSKEAEQLGLPVLVMGDVVREETVRQGLPLTSRNLSIVANSLREKYGREAIAVLLSEKIKSLETRFVVVDGVRSLDEVAVFEELGEACIVAFHASPATRMERIIRRGRPGDPRSWEEFVERDLVELSWGVGNVIALADYLVVNESTEEKAAEASRRILRELIDGEWRSCSRGRGKAYRRR